MKKLLLVPLCEWSKLLGVIWNQLLSFLFVLTKGSNPSKILFPEPTEPLIPYPAIVTDKPSLMRKEAPSISLLRATNRLTTHKSLIWERNRIWLPGWLAGVTARAHTLKPSSPPPSLFLSATKYLVLRRGWLMNQDRNDVRSMQWVPKWIPSRTSTTNHCLYVHVRMY